jgi:hypothetical protein
MGQGPFLSLIKSVGSTQKLKTVSEVRYTNTNKKRTDMMVLVISTPGPISKKLPEAESVPGDLPDEGLSITIMKITRPVAASKTARSGIEEIDRLREDFGVGINHPMMRSNSMNKPTK